MPAGNMVGAGIIVRVLRQRKYITGRFMWCMIIIMTVRTVFFAGLIGTAIGSYVVTSTYQQPLYNTVPVRDTQCFLLVSRKTNKAVKRCVDITDDFNQDDIYKVLYID